MQKKLLIQLLKNYQSLMYAHYVQDEINDYAYLEEVADAILALNKQFVTKGDTINEQEIIDSYTKEIGKYYPKKKTIVL